MDDAKIEAAPPSPWRPERNPRRIAVLGKLLEETNEGGSAGARALIQGIGESEPVTGKPNVEWLEDEFADTIALQRHAVEEFGLDITRIMARAEKKYAYLKAWFDSIPTEDEAVTHVRAMLAGWEGGRDVVGPMHAAREWLAQHG